MSRLVDRVLGFRLMRRFVFIAAACFMVASAVAAADKSGYYGYGQLATPEQIAGWDIDVRPDGVGLPPGSGTVEDGETLYEEQCAACHGSFGEGVGRFPSLAGGEGSLKDERPQKTVGSYWKYTSTLWDYIHRAMPFAQPESLSDDEVYAVTAYVLYLNDLVEDDFELTRENLSSIRLPNEGSFIPDQRPDVSNKHCMKNCKDPADISITSSAPVYLSDAALDESIKRGRAIAADRNAGNCYSCHVVTGVELPGNSGPPLVGMSARYPERVALKAQIADSRVRNPETPMPPYGAHYILTDAELESLVDYVQSL